MLTPVKRSATSAETKRKRMMPPIGFDAKKVVPSMRHHYRRFCATMQGSRASATRVSSAVLSLRFGDFRTLADKPLNQDVQSAGNEETYEPRIRVNRFPEFGDLEPRNGRRQETRQIDQNTNDERSHGRPIDPVRIFVFTTSTIQIIEIQVRLPENEIIGNHDPADRSEKRRISHEPREDIALRRLDELPRQDHRTNHRRNDAAHFVRNTRWRQIREIIGRGNDVRRKIRR